MVGKIIYIYLILLYFDDIFERILFSCCNGFLWTWSYPYRIFLLLQISACVVLTLGHSLIGKNLLPMLLELKSDVEPPEAFARLTKEHPLEKYLLEELEAMFRKIVGESLKEVLLPADKSFDLISTFISALGSPVWKFSWDA